MEVNLKDLATVEDLARLESRMSERIESRLALLEQRMTIKLGSLMMVSVGAVAALVKLV